MATRVHVFTVSTPAGTAEASPQTTALDFPEGRVEAIEVLVPPGPSGLAGWAIEHSQQRILPYESDQFVVADGEVIKWPLERFPTGRDWSVVTFNTDVYDHEIHIRMLVSDEEERNDAEALRFAAPAASMIGATGGAEGG